MGIAPLNALTSTSSYLCGFFFISLSPPGPVWLTLVAAVEVVEAKAFPVSFSSGLEGRSYM